MENQPISPAQNKIAFVIGGGPSLKSFRFELLKGFPIFAANKTAFDNPGCHLVSMDRDFCFHYQKEIAQFKDKAHLAPPDHLMGQIEGVRYYKRGRVMPILSSDRNTLPGLNSGFCALALAVKMGFKKIALLGIDMHSGQGHYHGGYSWNSPDAKDGIIRIWRDQFEQAAIECKENNIEVINYNKNSAIRGFKFGDIDNLPL